MILAQQTLRLASRESLSAADAGYLLAHGGQLVDIRSPADFRHGSLPGALNLPMDALNHDSGYLDRHEAVILCGNHGVACVRAARLLAGQGFDKIYFLMLQREPVESAA